jgi:alpha-methylacyl-CoA racemase
VKIIEIAGIGPGPFAGMMLGDLGADVVRIDRAAAVLGGDPNRPPIDILQRSRRSIGVDLKRTEGVEIVCRLAEVADGFYEPFRPGVAERLGIGPDVLLERNPRLVYGRMTGWGQDGPYAAAAGHDINYIALGGALFHTGRAGGPPTPPLNLVGDFGGGGMLLAYGMLAGLMHAMRSGEGQVVDVAMVDGTATLMTMIHAFRAMGLHDENSRGANLLDTGAPFYDVYETADGEYVAVGAIEPQFFAELVKRIGLADEGLPFQMDRSRWLELRQRLAEVFATKTRDEWADILGGTDACVAPVLRMSEAATHPHNRARGTFVEAFGVVQPAPSPRFSRTPGELRPPAHVGQHSAEILGDWLGLDAAGAADLLVGGAVR